MKKHRAGGKRKSFADIRRRYADGKKIKSDQLRKDSERIMDQLQSLVIRAGYADAPESAREQVRKYAAEVLPRMKRIARAFKRSDDPGGSYIEEGRAAQLERLKHYRFNK